jgi:hypothetical protein
MVEDSRFASSSFWRGNADPDLRQLLHDIDVMMSTKTSYGTANKTRVALKRTPEVTTK